MMVRWLFGVVLGLFACFGQAEVEGGQVDKGAALARLGHSVFVEGDFTQQRYLKGFTRPLTSRGNFSFWRQRGLYWEIQAPFFRATTYGHGDIINWSGTVAKVMKGDAVQKQISRLMLAILSADIEQLSVQFQVETEARSRGWAMSLAPKLPAVAQVIERIDVVGDHYLQRLDLIAGNGDKTVITFDGLNEASGPSAEKCRRFFATPDQRCEQD